ncbi:GTP-binding protein [Mytilinidion resinicola]|uniref:GTP-binding protein n=1 Tax=Mytilinidion resinicola TaxID=574789 RepID=A0A6A6Y5C7_9PEZI|nr:GTP-binding protein [Mytilinidion resinicola]KAF2803435.1 GTP-binding protein [Mytilinidion resinicola]
MATPIAPVAIDPEAVTTSSLKALQSDDQRKVMDIVDKLRRTGLSGIVGLPQLIVCGDQSSGKSSVLKAITEIPFPRKENLCTRFATEIILRRGPTSTIKISITPDKNRSKQEQAKLNIFSKSIKDFSQLPEIIKDATQVIGLGRVGEINSRAFLRDVLSVNICGPDQPQLTLVDLPGLIHATNKAQTEADKELILDLVKDYIKNPCTIILAVVSAKNDFANQIILDYCKKIDEKRERTLGIVTKPDYLREGTQNKLDWVELAQNKNIYFKLGWHMLKNRADNKISFSFGQRNKAEALFFSKGRYNNLPRDGNTVNNIEKLGKKRSTVSKQRIMLVKISMRVYNILKSAVKGYYKNNFFGPVNMEAAFANNIRLRGHKYTVGLGPRDDNIDKAEEEKAQSQLANLEDKDVSSLLPKPKILTRKEAIEWVQKETIASEHIDKIAKVCKDFVYIVLQHTAPAKFQGRLTRMCVDKALATALLACKEELRKIIADKAPTEASETVVYQSNSHHTYCDPAKMQKAIANSIKQNMDKFSSEEALDNQRAYYRDESKYFINAVAKQVIERHLVKPLLDIILSPLVVTQFTNTEVNFIAAEPPELTQQRTFLKSRKVMLQKGLNTFREAMGGLKR